MSMREKDYFTLKQSEISVKQNHIANSQQEVQNIKLFQSTSQVQQNKISKIPIRDYNIVINKNTHQNQKYLCYFNQYQFEVDKLLQKYNQLHSQDLFLHKLDSSSYHNRLFSFTKPEIIINGFKFNHCIIEYEYIIATHNIKIKLMHILQDAPTKQILLIDEGSFGSIISIKYCNGQQNIIAKRINFLKKRVAYNIIHDQFNTIITANKAEIQEIFSQYSIHRICSFYQIGPKLMSLQIFGVDLLCYNDSIQFFMERCSKVYANYSQLPSQLAVSVRIMHKLKIIHKDIKPQNILFSMAYKKFVLSDFGISHSIFEELGDKTKTFKEGTIYFMSQQMIKMKQKAQYIDLYYNDLIGLQKSLKFFGRNPLMKLADIKIIKYKMECLLSSHYFYLYIINLLQKSDNTKLLYLIQNNSQIIEQKQLKKYISKYLYNPNQKQQYLTKINIKKFENYIAPNDQQKIQVLIRTYGLTIFLLKELIQCQNKKIISRFQEFIQDQNNKNCIIKKNDEDKFYELHKNIFHKNIKDNLHLIYETIMRILLSSIIKIQNIENCEYTLLKLKLILNEVSSAKLFLIQIQIWLLYLKLIKYIHCVNYFDIQQYKQLLRIPQIFMIYYHTQQQKIQGFQNLIQSIQEILICNKKYSNYQKILLFTILSYVCINIKQVNKAFSYNSKAFEISTNDKILKMEIYYSYGNIFYTINKFNKALEYFQKSRIILEEVCLAQVRYQNIRSLAIHYNSMGNCYYELQKYEQSKLYYQRSLILEHSEGSKFLNFYLINLGFKYLNCEISPKLKKYQDNKKGCQKIITLLYNIVIYFYSKGHYQNCIKYSLQLLRIFQTYQQYKNNIKICLYVIIYCYFDTKQYSSALKYLRIIIKLPEINKKQHNGFLLDIAKTYFNELNNMQAASYYINQISSISQFPIMHFQDYIKIYRQSIRWTIQKNKSYKIKLYSNYKNLKSENIMTYLLELLEFELQRQHKLNGLIILIYIHQKCYQQERYTILVKYIYLLKMLCKKYSFQSQVCLMSIGESKRKKIKNSSDNEILSKLKMCKKLLYYERKCRYIKYPITIQIKKSYLDFIR